VAGAVSLRSVLELSRLPLKLAANVRLVAVLESLVLDRDDVVLVLLRQDLFGLHRLDGCVVVVLVNILVDGSGDVLVGVRLDVLLGDSLARVFVNSSLMLSVVGDEVRNSLLSLLHDDGCDVEKVVRRVVDVLN